jgi:probable HAF family extracellular repeat protein
MKLWPSIVFLILALGDGASSGAAQWYVITDMGSLGGQWTWAYGINDAGAVVGHALVADPALGGHSFLYSNRLMTDLYPFDIGFSWAGKYINNAGQIAGGARLGEILYPAVYHNGQFTLLPLLGYGEPGFRSGMATAINNSGDVAGWVSLTEEVYHAVVWRGGAVKDLGSFGAWSYASSMNDSGLVVGLSAYAPASPGEPPVQHPFLYDAGAGAMTDLYQFGLVSAVDVSNSGEIVGTVEDTAGGRQAVLLSNGARSAIHRLGVENEAAAINDRGQIVGTFRFPSGVDYYFDFDLNRWVEYVVYSWHAFVFEGGQSRDLNGLVFSGGHWDLQYATDVNNAGQIVGWGERDGELRGFLLSPALRLVIEVKPNELPNLVNLRSKGVFPVAILSTATFSALTVNPSSVLFGATGNEAVPVKSAFEDVNHDRRPDLVLHFRVQQTGIRPKDTAAILTGATWDGTIVIGEDSIRTVPPK